MGKKFSYEEINASGQKFKGKINAKNKLEVLDYIKSRGNTPANVEEIKEEIKREALKIQFGKKIKLDEYVMFNRQMATMLKAGMTITRALYVVSDQSENRYLKVSAKEIGIEVQKGSSFASSMKETDMYPKLMVNMLESGELTGNLDEIFETLSEHYSKESKINKKIMNAMMYPIILTGVMVISLNLIFMFLIPIFVDMLAGMELPLSTRILITLSNMTKKYWYLIISATTVIIISIKKYIKSNGGKKNLDELIFKLPLLKKPTITIATSRFTRTLSTLLKNGIPLITALETSANVTNNEVIKEGIKDVVTKIKKGRSLSIAIKELEIFPPMVISMMSIGEESGNLEELLSRTADFYDDELETALQRLVSLLEPVLIVVMGVIVGFIMVSIFLPLYTMYGTEL